MTRLRAQSRIASTLVNLCMHDHRQANQATLGHMAVSPDTIQTPHSTIRRNRIHIRHAVPPPPQTPPCTPPTLTPRPGHSLANHYNRLGSELNMPTNQPTQQPPPSLDKNNSGPVLDTPSPPQPQEPSTPATGPSELPIDTPLATIQEQPRDHQPEMRTRTRLIKPPTRFKDFELK